MDNAIVNKAVVKKKVMKNMTPKLLTADAAKFAEQCSAFRL
ncbi:hypothetical protein [Psychrobacter sp. UBA6730]|nr:hypothetical protein [Psychrobacter sp. UBA6730]